MDLGCDFDDEFFRDLDAINGAENDHWQAILLLRLRDGLSSLPEYQWHGRWDGTITNLSSGLWRPSGFRGLKIRLWYFHGYDTRRTLIFAEHPKSLAGNTAEKTALDRATQYGWDESKFRRRSEYND